MTQKSHDRPAGFVPHPRALLPGAAWIAFGIATSFFLLEFLVRVEPSLATNDIAQWFELSAGGFGVLSSLFFWIYAPMQMVVGLLLDRYGARRTIVPAILLCALGPILFAATNQPVIAGVGRLLMGFGGAFGFVGALYVVNHRFAPERFAVLSGLVNAVGMLGTAIAGVYLSSLVAVAGWRTVFTYTGIGGIGLFILALVFFHAPRAHPEHEPGRIRRDLTTVLRSRHIWAVALLGALYYAPVNVFGGLWGVTSLKTDHHLSQVSAEFAVSLIFWGMAVGSVLSGILADALGHRKWLLVVGAALCGLAYAGAIFLPYQSTAPIAVLLFVGGLAGGPQMLTFAMAKEAYPARVSGSVIAFVNMIGIGGALVFQPLVGHLIDLFHGNDTVAMTIIPAAPLIAALLGMTLAPERHPDHIS